MMHCYDEASTKSWSEVVRRIPKYKSDLGRKARDANSGGLEIDEAYAVVGIFIIASRPFVGDRTGITTRIHITDGVMSILSYQSN
jgi:hypothetical protein